MLAIVQAMTEMATKCSVPTPACPPSAATTSADHHNKHVPRATVVWWKKKHCTAQL